MPVDSNSDNLFVAFTPYNVFLSALIAHQSPSSVNDLVLIEDFSGANCLTDCLRDWDDSPFRKIITLPGVNSDQSLPKRVLRLAHSSRQIKRLVGRSDYGRVYVCNERRPESQVAAATAKSLNHRTLGITIEDGLNAYRLSPFAVNDGLINVCLKHRMYGSWFEDVAFAGGFTQTDRFLCWYPSVYNLKVHSPTIERSGIPECHGIELANQDREWLAGLAESMTSRVGLSENQLQDLRTILFLPKLTSQTSSTSWKQLIDDCLTHYGRTGHSLGFKYHPRDAGGDPFGIRQKPNTVEIPKWLPAEFVFVQCREKLELVLGGATTCLMTARCIGDVKNVYCIDSSIHAETSFTLSALEIPHLIEAKAVLSQRTGTAVWSPMIRETYAA